MKQALDTRTKLLTKSPWPLMIELSIPAVLGMVVVGLYNIMDSIFVGQMVGDVQMGAISVSYPLTLINAGSAAMLGVGSASVLSRAIGKKDENTIKKIYEARTSQKDHQGRGSHSFAWKHCLNCIICLRYFFFKLR